MLQAPRNASCLVVTRLASFCYEGVCPAEIKTTDLYKGITPFVILQIIGLIIIAIWPGFVTWLPALFAAVNMVI